MALPEVLEVGAQTAAGAERLLIPAGTAVLNPQDAPTTRGALYVWATEGYWSNKLPFAEVTASGVPLMVWCTDAQSCPKDDDPERESLVEAVMSKHVVGKRRLFELAVLPYGATTGRPRILQVEDTPGEDGSFSWHITGVR